jgi:oxygen-independent coproporphyrinogen-3 oxidase
MEAAGLPAYEVSNHARPGAEARHNLIYWRYGDYAGVGPGAHGRIRIDGKRIATAAVKLPERWRETVSAAGHGYAELMEVADEDAAREHLLMNLRLSEGIDLQTFRARWNVVPGESRIAPLEQLGLVICDGGRLRATSRGRLVLNRVIAELLH